MRVYAILIKKGGSNTYLITHRLYNFEHNVPIPLLVYNECYFSRLQKAVGEGILNEAVIAVIRENFGGYNRSEIYPPS